MKIARRNEAAREMVDIAETRTHLIDSMTVGLLDIREARAEPLGLDDPGLTTDATLVDRDVAAIPHVLRVHDAGGLSITRAAHRRFPTQIARISDLGSWMRSPSE